MHERNTQIDRRGHGIISTVLDTDHGRVPTAVRRTDWSVARSLT